MAEATEIGEARLYLGDCLAVMRELPDNSVDSIVTDPPAGVAFMNCPWDSHSKYQPRTKRGETFYTALADLGLFAPWELGFLVFTIDWAFESLRVLKPGGIALVWALPRTSDLTAMGLRLGGYEIRDRIAHLFGSGFPKGHNVAQALERAVIAAIERAGYTFTGWADE